eukprot:5045317-Pyramimonas_sp.AAC.2
MVYPDAARVVVTRAAGLQASTGLAGLVILLHACAHVDAYGFVADVGSDSGSDEFRSWYWEKYPGYK